MSHERRFPINPTNFLGMVYGSRPEPEVVDRGLYVKPRPEPRLKQKTPEEEEKIIRSAMLRNPVRAGICGILFKEPGYTFGQGLCIQDVQGQFKALQEAQVIEIVDTKPYLTPLARKVAEGVFGKYLRR